MDMQSQPKNLVVWKIALGAGLNEIELPKGAKVLSVALQHDAPQMWFICNPAAEKEKREFLFVGTGHEFAADNYKFVGTLTTDDKAFVFHVFEKMSPLAALMETIF